MGEGQLQKKLKEGMEWIRGDGEQSLSAIRAVEGNLWNTIEEAKKDFPEMEDIRKTTPKDVDKTVLWVKLANRRKTWFVKWFGGVEEK